MTKKHIWLEKILPPTIIIISVLLYLNSLSNTFVYDDAYVITENYFKYKKDAQKSLYYLNESLRLAPNPTEAKKVTEIIQAINTGQNF